MKRLLPSAGDIFVKRRHKRHTKTTNAPWTTVGVLCSMTVVILGVNAAVIAEQNTGQAATAKTITDNVAKPVTPGIMQFLPHTNTPSLRTVMIAQQTSVETEHRQPTPTLTPNNPSTDLNSILNQINQTNSAIVSNMYTCITITRQAQAKVLQLRGTEKQLQTTMDELRQQERNLVRSDPNTPARRAQLRTQRDQLSEQRSQVLTTISQTKRQYYTDKNACTSSVYDQQKAKRKLESQLNDAFRTSMNIRID